MQSIQSLQTIYHAAVYLRLSREDGDVADGNKQVSNSISNQKDLIHGFLKSHTDIELYKEYVDDGYSGVNFERPQFQAMLADIRSGVVNCVIVKDLSRFGRNYIESGRYIEKIFPMLNVRFIAVTDHYDSITRQEEYGADMMIPFKNLMNDAYCRDISVKIRSHLDVKRKNGQYIGAFVVYGYAKDRLDKNRIVIDEYAAEVVRDIFAMKICGMSNQRIADKLNADGILSPMEYKRSIGIRFESSFKKGSKALWSYNAVLRILKNEMYIGVMEQGKQTTPNYKIKTVVHKKKEEWIRVENAHEPIIAAADFQLVQELLDRDTRMSLDTKMVGTFSGVLYCADCGKAMIRKVVPSGSKRYFYYVCSAHHKDKSVCSPHRFAEAKLTESVLATIQKHIEAVIELQEALRLIEQAPYRKADISKYQERIRVQEEENEKLVRRKANLYDDLKDGVLDKSQYQMLKEEYDRRIETANHAVCVYQKEMKMILDHQTEGQKWMESFRAFHNVQELDRRMISVLVDYIRIYDNHTFVIVFRYMEEYEAVKNYVAAYADHEAGREAV